MILAHRLSKTAAGPGDTLGAGAGEVEILDRQGLQADRRDLVDGQGQAAPERARGNLQAWVGRAAAREQRLQPELEAGVVVAAPGLPGSPRTPPETPSAGGSSGVHPATRKRRGVSL